MAVPTHSANNRHSDNWWLEDIAASLAAGGSGSSGGAYNTTPPVYNNGDPTTFQTDQNGNQKVVGNVASGTADSGAPVKVGGVFNSALPTLTAGQRSDLQLASNGALVCKVYLNDSFGNGLSQQTPGDTMSGASTTALGVSSFNAVYNGTNYVRMRGDVNGVYVGGNVASGGTDAGNPVKTGGVFQTTQPTVTTGQRVDGQYTSRGEQKVAIFNGAQNLNTQTDTNGGDGLTASQIMLTVANRNYVFNGTTFDRQRGSAAGGTFNNVTATPTVTTVSVGTTSTSVLASNTSRKKLILTNVGANNIFVNMAGGTAVNTNIQLAPGQTIIDDTWVSQTAITAIAATGATNLSVTEYA